MDKNMEIWANTRQLVAKNFALPDSLAAGPTEADLLAALTDTIAQMLAQAPERLFALLYQLDVSELEVHKALAPQATKLPAAAIAELVLLRQKQKAITRLQYQSPPPNPDDDDASAW